MNPGAGTDEALILEVRHGSSDAMAELFARYRDRIYGFFRRRLNDDGRAEELAQETFIAILRGAARYEPRAKFRTYLYGIAMRQLFAERRKGHGAGASADRVEEAPTRAFNEDSLWIRDALQKIDVEHREVLLLREYEGLTYEEISTLLGVPLNTVRSRLFRARVAMRDQLLSSPAESRQKS